MSARSSKSALVLTQHYWPEPIGSAPYLTDLGEWLAAHDHEVRVFTCRPHYPDGYVARAYRHGRRDEETRSGTLIERVAPFQPWRRGALGRMAREVLFLMQGLGALVSGRIRRSPLVVSLCPSVFTVLLGVAARQRRGHHVVMVHDIQSGLASGLGMVGGCHIAALMQWLERVVFNRADMILVLSDSMRRRLRSQGVRKPIEILPIWVNTSVIRPARAPRGNSVTVIYSGNFGKKQGLGQVVDMAELLERRASPVRVLLRGEGSEAVKMGAEIENPEVLGAPSWRRWSRRNAWPRAWPRARSTSFPRTPIPRTSRSPPKPTSSWPVAGRSSPRRARAASCGI